MLVVFEMESLSSSLRDRAWLLSVIVIYHHRLKRLIAIECTELRHPSIIPLVAEKMALLHEQVLPAKKEARLWSQLDEWLTEGGAHSLLKALLHQ